MKAFNLKEYLKNPSRRVVTRDGRAVKIYCTDYVDGPIIAKIEDDVFSHSFREDGRYVDYEETDYDLFFAPEKYERYINIYRDTTGVSSGAVLYDSREDAEKVGKSDGYYAVTAKVEWEE